MNKIDIDNTLLAAIAQLDAGDTRGAKETLTQLESTVFSDVVAETQQQQAQLRDSRNNPIADGE